MKILKRTLGLLILAVIAILVYTLVCTGLGQLCFNHQVNGSLVSKDGQVVGSRYLSQPQTSAGYLWGRYEEKNDYKGGAYGKPSNQTVSSEDYKEELRERGEELGMKNPPIDLLTGSASGLDPQISYSSALAQADRIAQARGMSKSEVCQIIDKHTSGSKLGHPATNVLEVNIDLDEY